MSTWQTFTQYQPSPTIVPHPLNEYPAKVDLQIRVTEGSQEHIFSGIGSCQRDDDDPNPYGGIVYIYNHKEVKLYTPSISDTPQKNTDGSFAYTGGLSFNGPFFGNYTTADVRSQAVDGAYANYVFEGTGSAQSDGSTFFERIGAVVYAYNSKEVNLWYPGSEDYLIFIGGAWGSGAPTQTSKTASVSVKVINAESPLSGCGLSLCSSNWNTLTTTCSPSHPIDIPNADKFILDNNTIYTCVPGYQSNGGKSVIAYNGTNWEETDYSCSEPASCLDNSNNKTLFYNITILEKLVESLKRNLTIDMKNTSAYRRSLTCATDPRASASHLGFLGIFILSLTGGLFVCADLSRVVKSTEKLYFK
ncbi:uncharacterized protein LOC128177943 [Crassostrea angulata]|uniref:uncharacterized protein LOC128177943 n=1 Tax=Magallana angulata TaxID=2784310 RepID=UPI0022B0FC83|nr:uncharacterized protein LOC128177943 [Crassostrea angulata]